MGNDKIRPAVEQYLRQQGTPATIGEMAAQIRDANVDLRNVSDFDVRSTVLRMMAVGQLESKETNQIALPHRAVTTRG